MNVRINSRVVVVGLLAISSSGCRYLWDGDFDEREAKARASAQQREDAHRQADSVQRELELARQPGRYVIVNPTPDVVANTMLLDTVTGDTWLRCKFASEDAEFSPTTDNVGWCGKLRRTSVDPDRLRRRAEARRAAALEAPGTDVAAPEPEPKPPPEQ